MIHVTIRAALLILVMLCNFRVHTPSAGVLGIGVSAPLDNKILRYIHDLKSNLQMGFVH